MKCGTHPMNATLSASLNRTLDAHSRGPRLGTFQDLTQTVDFMTAIQCAVQLLYGYSSWFIGYPKETAGYYFYDPTEQKIFISSNAVFLKKGFPSDSRRDEALIEESSEEPHHDNTTSFEPTVHTDGVSVLRRSTRESRVPERYGFIGLTSQLDNDPKTYGEAMSDIDSDKWLETMKSEMDSMGSNHVWTHVDPPKSVRPVGCKWSTNVSLELMGRSRPSRPGLWRKDALSDLGSTLRKPIRLQPWPSPFGYCLPCLTSNRALIPLERAPSGPSKEIGATEA
ncbi:UNVERIFIED_CONTAM: hypothetical protein Slati_4241200 [Sesamum latifolium]|uniref:Retroviral polymerase SH3-like domain-containing protein n=1 Tax=Sesamum latifolium TaxID=2727402 RepID=A0AAW2TC30_9LAMI